MDSMKVETQERSPAKAQWQEPTIQEYDATREIQGANVELLGDVLITGGS